ncbi:MAG: substrate-binding domain-containing protein [Betaproteobacteria bacterium]
MEIRILSGGAAAGVVQGIQADFEKQHGCVINGTFSAVGAMRDQLTNGAPCDLVILTKTLIEELITSGHVLAGTSQSLGLVLTGLAVPTGRPAPAMSNAEELKSAFRGASSLYFPDMVKSTAGIHFMNVMKALGLDQELASRFKTFPNGATAMTEMGKSTDPKVLGGTQTTEINITPGVTLIGLLPKEFELATDYTLGICTHSTQPALAKLLAQTLTGNTSKAVREKIGYVINA